jgi:hypothetical protein
MGLFCLTRRRNDAYEFINSGSLKSRAQFRLNLEYPFGIRSAQSQTCAEPVEASKI